MSPIPTRSGGSRHRGRVTATTDQGGHESIHEISQKYLGIPYPYFSGGGGNPSETRLILTIEADKVTPPPGEDDRPATPVFDTRVAGSPSAERSPGVENGARTLQPCAIPSRSATLVSFTRGPLLCIAGRTLVGVDARLFSMVVGDR